MLRILKLKSIVINRRTDISFFYQILLKHFGLFGPPAIIFFNQQPEEIKSYRLIGFVKPENFIEHIKQIKSL